MSALSTMNPLAPASTSEPKTEESEPTAEDSAMAGLNPFASSDGTGPGEAKENAEQPPPAGEVKGGKKRNRKSPKSKKSKRRTKRRKAQK